MSEVRTRLSEAGVDEVLSGSLAARPARISIHQRRSGRQIRHTEGLEGVGISSMDSAEGDGHGTECKQEEPELRSSRGRRHGTCAGG